MDALPPYALPLEAMVQHFYVQELLSCSSLCVCPKLSFCGILLHQDSNELLQPYPILVQLPNLKICKLWLRYILCEDPLA